MNTETSSQFDLVWQLNYETSCIEMYPLNITRGENLLSATNWNNATRAELKELVALNQHLWDGAIHRYSCERPNVRAFLLSSLKTLQAAERYDLIAELAESPSAMSIMSIAENVPPYEREGDLDSSTCQLSEMALNCAQIGQIKAAVAVAKLIPDEIRVIGGKDGSYAQNRKRNVPKLYTFGLLAPLAVKHHGSQGLPQLEAIMEQCRRFMADEPIPIWILQKTADEWAKLGDLDQAFALLAQIRDQETLEDLYELDANYGEALLIVVATALENQKIDPDQTSKKVLEAFSHFFNTAMVKKEKKLPLGGDMLFKSAGERYGEQLRKIETLLGTPIAIEELYHQVSSDWNAFQAQSADRFFLGLFADAPERLEAIFTPPENRFHDLNLALSHYDGSNETGTVEAIAACWLNFPFRDHESSRLVFAAKCREFTFQLLAQKQRETSLGYGGHLMMFSLGWMQTQKESQEFLGELEGSKRFPYGSRHYGWAKTLLDSAMWEEHHKRDLPLIRTIIREGMLPTESLLRTMKSSIWRDPASHRVLDPWKEPKAVLNVMRSQLTRFQSDVARDDCVIFEEKDPPDYEFYRYYEDLKLIVDSMGHLLHPLHLAFLKDAIKAYERRKNSWPTRTVLEVTPQERQRHEGTALVPYGR